ncbi:MAG: hypothetical protein ABR520_10570 [Mycobacteriales bacterium]
MPAPFDPEAIVEVLARHEVDFIAIGGFAAFLQGSPFPTRDVDITPRRDPDNLARLSAALTELDARVRAASAPQEGLPFAHNAPSLDGVDLWNLSTRFGDLDISFVPTGTQGYQDLRRDAVRVELRGTPILLASLADIVRSKGACNRDKDRRVLPVLRELLVLQRQERTKTRRRGG